MSGIDMALKAMANFLGIKAEDVQNQFAGLGQIAVSLKGQLDRMEANQRFIIAMLKAAHPEIQIDTIVSRTEILQHDTGTNAGHDGEQGDGKSPQGNGADHIGTIGDGKPSLN